MKRLLACAAMLAVSLIISRPLEGQSNPAVGTWKLNVAKSDYTVSHLTTHGPRSETRTVEDQGTGAKYSYEGVAGDGRRIAFSWISMYDGQDSPISGVGQPNDADTIATTRVDAHTFTGVAKKAGKVVLTTRVVISDDGKVTTVTSEGTNEKGQAMSATTVWDKQ